MPRDPVTDAFTFELIERAIKQHYDDTQATLDTHYGCAAARARDL